MATYLQGVTDYIPDYQPFQPDLNFYANTLQAKQTQYDSNYKSLNNLYSTLYNAPVTHELNKEKKDVLIKQIDDNLKKVSGLDLSLEQNVQQATQVFRPFYEDKYLMKDMAWTKNTMNVLGNANSLRNSENPDIYEQWWQTGIDAINYRTQEFGESSLDETMNFQNVSYTKYTNAVQDYMDMATKLKISAEHTDLTADGKYIVTQKNGSLIIPTLQQLFNAEYAKNPRLQEIYSVQAYVDRKNWVAQHEQDYNGDKLTTEKEYLQQKYNFISNLVNKENVTANDNLNTTKNKVDAVENDIANGDVNIKQQKYLDALANGATVQEAIAASTKKLNKDLNTGNRTSVTVGQPSGLNLENLKLARLKVDAGVASLLATKDINRAAKAYSDIGKEYKRDISKIGMEDIRNRNARSRIRLAASLKKETDRQSNFEKYMTDKGMLMYDMKGNLVPDPKFDGSFKEQDGGDPGQSTDQDVDINKLNKKTWKQFTDESTSGWTDQFMIDMKNLVDKNEISNEEIARFMIPGASSGINITSGFSDSKEEYRNILREEGTLNKIDDKQFKEGLREYRISQGILDENDNVTDKGRKLKEEIYGTENAKSEFNKIYKLWKENKSTTVNGQTFTYRDHLNREYAPKIWVDEWDTWSKRNAGNTVVENYLQRSDNILKMETYRATYDANEAVFEQNNDKIVTELRQTVNQLGLDDKVAEETVELFNNIVNLSDIQGNDALSDFTEDEMLALFNNKLTQFQYAFANLVDSKGGKIKGQQTMSSQGGSSYDMDGVKTDNAMPMPYLPKFQDGTDWNETKGILPEQWAMVNQMLDNDPRMRSAMSELGLSDDGSTPITSPEYYNFDPASGYGDIKRLRDDIVKQYRKGINVEIFETDEEIQDFAQTAFTLLNAKYDEIVFRPSGDNALLSYIPTTAGTDGRASLASETQSQYVNMQVPGSAGFKDYAAMVRDINNINFNQAGNYRISLNGNMLPEDFSSMSLNKNDMNPDFASRLLQDAYLAGREGAKGMGDLKISNNQVSMEDAGTGSMTVNFSKKFLEEYVTSIPEGTMVNGAEIEGENAGKAEFVKQYVDQIYQNGITFIAPKQQWTNPFFNNNQVGQTEAIMNALGSLNYSHPNGAGSYTLEKINNVPGVTHRGVFEINYIDPQTGELKTKSQELHPNVRKNGDALDQTLALMFNSINQTSVINNQLFQSFVKSDNTEALNKVRSNQKLTLTPKSSGFKYGNN